MRWVVIELSLSATAEHFVILFKKKKPNCPTQTEVTALLEKLLIF